MSTAKIAVSLDEKLVERLNRLVEEGVYPSRSRAIQEAVAESLARSSRDRLARECSKLDPEEEVSLAEEGLNGEGDLWPEY